MHINWFGPCFGNMGYSRHNRELIRELQKQDVKIHLNPSDSIEEDIPDYLQTALLTQRKNDGITIHLVPTPALWGDDGYNILYTMTESRFAHPGLVRRASYFPEVWIPSRYNYISLAPFLPPDTKIQVIPEGYCPDTWYPEPYQKFNTFTFLYLGDWTFRKGPHELCQAFTEEFAPGEAKLIFVTKLAQTKNDPKSQAQIIKEAEEHATYNNRSLQDIMFFFSDLTDDSLRFLLSQVHCFIMPTKGEAWGLPILEAMACGLPVIVPIEGGHREFSSQKTGWLTKGYYDRLDHHHAISTDFYLKQEFFFPDIDSVRKAMRQAYQDPQKCEKIGKKNAEYAKQNWTWEKSARKIINRIEIIEQHGYTPLRRGKRL